MIERTPEDLAQFRADMKNIDAAYRTPTGAYREPVIERVELFGNSE